MASHQQSPKGKRSNKSHTSTQSQTSISDSSEDASPILENLSQNTPEQILQLQSLIGNQAVMRLINSDHNSADSPALNMFLQRTPIANKRIIQRDGEGVDQYTVLKDQTMALINSKQSIKSEIENLQATHDNEKDRKKRRRLRVQMSKLERKAARLQYRIDDLFEKMKPLYKAEKNVDTVLEQQQEDRKKELKDVASSSPVENAKRELEEEKKRKQAEEDKKYKTYAEMEALSLTDLRKYVKETPNWHMRSTHSTDQKKTVEDIHALVLEAGTLAALGSFTVASLVNEAGTMTEKLASLRDLVKAVKDDDPFPISAPSDMANAMKKAKALNKLKAGFPNYVLNSAMVHEEYFDYLMQFNLIDDVVSYYNTASSKPIFQANNGKDFLSYIQMRVNEGVDPLSYDSTILQGKIRSFHRFQAAALNQLKSNYAEKGVRPLTLILHSAVDHNGAFHREDAMTAVIKNSNINALMIEGGETLDSYKSQITPLAKEYGIHGMLDQVLFAGHGGSQVIELGGKVKEGKNGKLQEDGQPINLKTDKTAADELFDEVLKNMDVPYADDFIGPQLPKQKNRRILFDACLTNSNAVEKAITGDISQAKAEIAKYLQDNSSLATYLGQRAKEQGRDIKSMGANASIGEFDMVEDTGELTMKSTVDPKIAADKIEYAEEGHEPLGTLRAALESWASDEAETINAMQRRAAWGSTGWDDVVIESIYKEILASGDVSNNLANFITIAHDLSSIKSESHADIAQTKWMVTSFFSNAELDPIFAELEASDEWSTNNYIPLIINQLWMHYFPGDPNLHEAFLSHLGTNFNVKTGRKYVDISYLSSENLMTPLMSFGSKVTGKLILALIGLLDSNEAKSKKYLKGKLSNGASEVPGLPKVPAVPAVPEQDPPRAKVPKVPAVPGREKVIKIPGKRAEVPEVPDLPELPELVAVESDASGKAPGREKREKRDKVPKVPAVDKYFQTKWKISTLLAGTATEQEIIDKVK